MTLKRHSNRFSETLTLLPWFRNIGEYRNGIFGALEAKLKKKSAFKPNQVLIDCTLNDKCLVFFLMTFFLFFCIKKCVHFGSLLMVGSEGMTKRPFDPPMIKVSTYVEQENPYFRR